MVGEEGPQLLDAHLGEDLDTIGSGLLLVLIGSVLAVYGAMRGRRFTTWGWCVGIAVGVLLIAGELAGDNSAALGITAIVLGAGVIVIAQVLTANLAEPDEMTPGPSTFTRGPTLPPGQWGQPPYPGYPTQPVYPAQPYPGYAPQPGQPTDPSQPGYPGYAPQPGQSYPGYPPQPPQPADPSQPGQDVTPVEYTPLGPEGLCFGGSWTATMELDDCADCEE